MKKFFISLIILVILGGAALYFGWVKASVPAGEYGVIISKTHGTDAEVVQDGKFRWLWYKLIPTNVKILSFRLRLLEKNISAGGSLPSANTYASFSGISMDFSYEVNGTYSFQLKPEMLPSLVEKNSVGDQDSLNAYLDSLSEKISGYTIQQIGSFSGGRNTLEALRENPVLPDLTNKVLSMFPEITDFTCTITNVRFPDFDLYDSAKTLYQNYLSRQGEILMEKAAVEAAEKINAQDRFDELTRYGELLTKYPILIQYMAIEKGLDIEAIESLQLNEAP